MAGSAGSCQGHGAQRHASPIISPVQRPSQNLGSSLGHICLIYCRGLAIGYTYCCQTRGADGSIRQKIGLIMEPWVVFWVSWKSLLQWLYTVLVLPRGLQWRVIWSFYLRVKHLKYSDLWMTQGGTRLCILISLLNRCCG
jgi:hypothetical protein